MSFKKEHGAQQGDQDSEQSVTNKTVIKKRPAQDTQFISSIKKQRYSADDIVSFVGQKTILAEIKKLVTAPQSVRKRQLSPTSVSDNEWQGTVSKRARQDDCCIEDEESAAVKRARQDDYCIEDEESAAVKRARQDDCCIENEESAVVKRARLGDYSFESEESAPGVDLVLRRRKQSSND